MQNSPASSSSPTSQRRTPSTSTSPSPRRATATGRSPSRQSTPSSSGSRRTSTTRRPFRGRPARRSSARPTASTPAPMGRLGAAAAARGRPAWCRPWSPEAAAGEWPRVEITWAAVAAVALECPRRTLASRRCSAWPPPCRTTSSPRSPQWPGRRRSLPTLARGPPLLPRLPAPPAALPYPPGPQCEVIPFRRPTATVVTTEAEDRCTRDRCRRRLRPRPQDVLQCLRLLLQLIIIVLAPAAVTSGRS